MNIGVITLPFNANYGWLLQAYAMQKVLEKNGHNAILIERKWNLGKGNNSLLSRLMRPFYYNVNCGKLYRFYKKNIKATHTCRSNDEIKRIVDEYHLDAVIVGSDQVWRIENTRGVGYNFFLDFVPSGTIKFSYAASFGSDVWKGNEKDNLIIRELLDSFNGISVREESGIQMCKELFDKDAQCVLDPTFLLDASDYDKLLPNPQKYSNIKLLVTYILDPSAEKEYFVNKIAEERKLMVDRLFLKSRKGRFHIYKSLENWLLKIRNADFVVVDSFHGMVFCIIFQKQFIVIANKKRGNTRFENVLGKLNLMDRLIYDLADADIKQILQPINYTLVDQRLELEKQASVNFINKALS